MLLIDTNVLILLVIGCTRIDLISKHSRSKSYNKADFDLAMSLIGDLRRIVLIPHVLTETSNLIGQYREPDKSSIRKMLKSFILMYKEHVDPSINSVMENIYTRLGLTDAAIILAAKQSIPLLTDDLDLFNALNDAGLPSTYFFHERLRAGHIDP